MHKQGWVRQADGVAAFSFLVFTSQENPLFRAIGCSQHLLAHGTQKMLKEGRSPFKYFLIKLLYQVPKLCPALLRPYGL